MRVPSRLATSQIVSPLSATTVLPSSVNSTLSVISGVLAEMHQQVIDRIGRGLTEAANRRVAHDCFQIAQGRLVERAFPLQQRNHLACSLAARRALAAAFVAEELQQVDRRRPGAVLVREYHHRM